MNSSQSCLIDFCSITFLKNNAAKCVGNEAKKSLAVKRKVTLSHQKMDRNNVTYPLSHRIAI
jgi:hypothetical protein